MGKGNYQKIYEVVKQIPSGRVATYGQIARLSGIPGQARQVGYALSALKDLQVPWHRVVNAKGKISRRTTTTCENRQKELLEEEGICFNQSDQISLTDYRWII